jgi:hypothetical protein
MYPDRYDYANTSQVNWNWHNELNINIWQGWWIGDKEKEVINILDAHNINGYFQPDTLRWLTSGKVQINEAEETDINNNPIGRFRYNNHWCGQDITDNSTFGNGARVRYYDKTLNCSEQNPSGNILTDINENGICSFARTTNDPVYECGFPGRDPNNYWYVDKWYLKPRMRISTTDAFGPVLPVIKIVAISYDGLFLDEITLTTEDFRQGNINTYDGSYIEDYFRSNMLVDGNLTNGINRGRGNIDWHDVTHLFNGDCKVDFKIYWYGQVDVWIDYVKLIDQPAVNLMGENNLYRNRIKAKVQALLDEDNGKNRLKGFYTEEIEYSYLTCLKYMQDFLQTEFPNNGDKVKINCLINDYSFYKTLKENNPSQDYTKYIQMVNPSVFMFTGYFFFTFDSYFDNYHKAYLPPNVSFSFPSYCPQVIQDQINSSYPLLKKTYNEYTDQIQINIFNSFVDTIRNYKAICNANGIDFIVVPNICAITYSGSQCLREPLNSEISAVECIAITYGAKGIIPYAWSSYYTAVPNIAPRYTDKSEYQMGMADFDDQNHYYDTHKREKNYFGENKWQYVSELNHKFQQWGPVIANSTNTTGFSVAREGADHEYINNIQSIKPNGTSNCMTDDITPLAMDCYGERYWEMGFFDPSSGSSPKYVLMVNRRCVPAGGNYAGDNRILRIRFEADMLSTYGTWKISDVLHPDESYAFLKSYQGVGGFVAMGSQPGNAGYFTPGDGKLFKLEPVPTTGGELLADEVIPAGETITLTDTLFTNGYNLTIEDGAQISLTDTSAIVVNGGSFTAGTSASINPVIFNTVGKGLTFNNAEVRIYNSLFSGINDDTSYAVNIVNCPVVDIRNSDFTSGSNSYSGGINMTYYTEPEGGNNIYLGYNTFDAGTSTIPFVNIMAYSGTTVPALMEHNTFTSTSGAMALMLSGVTGGAVKSNTFTDFVRAVSALSSSIDVYGNTFTNESVTSTGLEGLSGTELRLNKVSRTFIGGLNNFSNNQSSSRNILVDYSYYLLDGGENVFNIGSDNESKHLRGSFPYPVPVSTNATVNCFKVNQTVSSPVADVTSNGSPVSFVFEPYLSGCDPNGGGDEMVINLGDGIYDTVSVMAGSGGKTMTNDELRMTGDKSISNFDCESREPLSIANLKIDKSLQSEIDNSRFAITAKQLYDSICIQMRYRNYSYVKDRCEYMLNAYPDSLESIYAAHKLYLAVSVTDTTTSGRTALKTLYETIILNHPNNTSLVQKCNYLVQKCKVLLHQYSSALAGFQQIINNNPYSYEGLVAHWDYMATSLLIQGMGGGEGQESMTNDELRMTGDNIVSLNSVQTTSEPGTGLVPGTEFRVTSDESGDPFTKEERKQINKTVTQSYEWTKESGQKKIEMLTKLASDGNKESAKQVKMMKTLEQVVTTQKPKNLFEHINIVKNDLKRVFGSDNSGKNKTNNIIPNQYSLSQNYPNPFNPETTIKYALPRDVKVLIKIYDILGREVQTLVNEFKKAGYYEIKFNGSNFASGVYFYRIESGDFVVSKKMVLIK